MRGAAVAGRGRPALLPPFRFRWRRRGCVRPRHAMSALNWKPFVYGGLASIVAEFGEEAVSGGGQEAAGGPGPAGANGGCPRRHLPRGPHQDAAAGAGPERRCPVPGGPVPRHVPRSLPHLPGGGRPGPLLWVSTRRAPAPAPPARHRCSFPHTPAAPALPTPGPRSATPGPAGSRPGLPR